MAVAATAFLAADAHARPFSSDASRQIRGLVAPYVKAGQFSGVILVKRDGGILFQNAYGFANAELKTPNTIHTVFGIASVTKLMTTTIRQSLIDRGFLADGDRLSKFLPTFPHGDAITIDMLATHRSGIPHRVTTAGQEAVAKTSEEMVQLISTKPLLFVPGSKRLYSSSGYVVLARAMEIASNRSYDELLRSMIFAPSGISGCTSFQSGKLMENRASEYLPSPAGIVNAPPKDYSFLLGAGSVFCTAGDLLKFGEGVVGGRYGETIRSRLAPNGLLVANGVTNGHRAFMKIDTKSRTEIVLVSNLNSGANDIVLAGIDAVLAGKSPPLGALPKPKIVTQSATLSRFPGHFVPRGNPNGLAIDLITSGGRLSMGDWPLYQTSPDCFFEYQNYGQMCFSSGDGPQVLTWKTPTFSAEWVREGD